MKDKWIKGKGFVEPFTFKENEKIELTSLAQVSIDSPLIESFRRIIELKRMQPDHFLEGAPKKSLCDKIESIENGLSKSIKGINDLNETIKRLLPQYMLAAEQDLTNQQNGAKIKPNFDPRLELNILLKAFESMRVEIVDSKNVRAMNHTFFVKQCVDAWIDNGGYIGSEIERKKAWLNDPNNPAVPLLFTIQYMLSIEGIHLRDPNNWIEKALG